MEIIIWKWFWCWNKSKQQQSNFSTQFLLSIDYHWALNMNHTLLRDNKYLIGSSCNSQRIFPNCF